MSYGTMTRIESERRKLNIIDLKWWEQKQQQQNKNLCSCLHCMCRMLLYQILLYFFFLFRLKFFSWFVWSHQIWWFCLICFICTFHRIFFSSLFSYEESREARARNKKRKTWKHFVYWKLWVLCVIFFVGVFVNNCAHHADVSNDANGRFGDGNIFNIRITNTY